jgi:glycosyltransferase involved in cell wall biosynthesis
MRTAILFSGVWPEHRSSAAGVRTRSLLKLLGAKFARVICASAARENRFTEMLRRDDGVECHRVELNNSHSFAKLSRSIDVKCPDIVLYDTFTAEERFGSHVHQRWPRAVTLLDTQDLHFLRRWRQRRLESLLNNKIDTAPVSLCSGDTLFCCDVAFDRFDSTHDALFQRELASIHRCDMTWLVSTSERDLLLGDRRFGVDPRRVELAPFLFDDGAFCERQRALDRRKHFVTIGHCRHAPNVDSLHALKHDVWPALAERCGGVAQMHVFGAHALRETMAMDDAASRFRVRGSCADQYATLARYRVLLAPLRFGAGIKGKIVDSFIVGTPVVTTPIGAEGLHFDDSPLLAKHCVARSTDEFVDKAHRLHTDDALWTALSDASMQHARTHFSRSRHATRLLEHIDEHIDRLDEHRSSNHLRNMLWNEHNRSTHFQSKWLEQKEASRSNDHS